jgi:hypothetical protein
MRPKKGDLLISATDQTKYRSVVSMILYLVKHTRQDISNSVKKLSKVADGATKCHWKAMIQLMKYVVDTETYAFKLCPQI